MTAITPQDESDNLNSWIEAEEFVEEIQDPFAGAVLRTIFYAFKKSKQIDKKIITANAYLDHEGCQCLNVEHAVNGYSVFLIVDDHITPFICKNSILRTCFVSRWDLTIESFINWLQGDLEFSLFSIEGSQPPRYGMWTHP